MILPHTLPYLIPKNKIRNITFLIVVSLHLFFTSLFSQTSSDRSISLEKAIAVIEQKFAYQFTYEDDTIAGKFVHEIPEVETIQEILNFLKEQTRLRFTVLNSNFIVIHRSQSGGRSICGYLKVFSTGRPLMGTTIQGKYNSVVSDLNGYFELTVYSEKEPIIFGHLGYRTIKLNSYNFDKEDCLSINMFAKMESLPEIWVKNYLAKGISKNNDGSLLIDYSNFELLPGLIETDVLQTIQALPGIQSANESISNINIRGGTHDQNLILWDGIKMYQSGHFFGLISVFNPDLTEKVLLVKNGTAVEFSEGTSGTILMNSETRVNTKFKGAVGINLINADVFLDVPVGKNSSVQLSARKAINDFIDTPTYTSYFDRVSQDTELQSSEEVQTSDIQFDFYDTNIRWNFAITNKDWLRVNFLNIDNELIFKESLATNSVFTARQSSLRQNSIAGGVYYKRTWNDDIESFFQYYETRYGLRAENVNVIEDQLFIQENKISETNAKLKTSYQVKLGTTLSVGYQFTETGITNSNDIDDPRFREENVRVLRNHAIFSDIKYKSNKLQNVVDFGVRYTYNEKFKRHFLEPRLSFNQKFLNYFNIEVLGELKHQNTSQIINFQNDFLGIEKRRWVLADDKEVPVIQSRQASLGLQYKRKGWLLNVEGYYKSVEGITARSQGFLNKYEFRKAIGSYEVLGVDFLVNKRFKHITSWLSYSNADNTYMFSDFEEVFFPNNIDITHTLNIGSSYSLKNLSVAVGLNWHSGLPTTLPDFDNPTNGDAVQYGKANSTYLEDYVRLDISATYNFLLYKNIKAKTGAAIWNLTGSNNQIGSYYRLNEANEPQQFLNSALGFTPNFSFEVFF